VTAPTSVPAARALADLNALRRELVVLSAAIGRLAADPSTAAHVRVALEQVHDHQEAATEHLRQGAVKLDQVAREVG